MSFERSLSLQTMGALTSAKNSALFEKLKADVLSGCVFPAVRANELHFYYKGGLLYKYCGRFARNKAYDCGRYDDGTQGLDGYEKAKKQNENKFTSASGENKERALLDGLYGYTYGGRSDIFVLDIEVNLNGGEYAGKKCDLVLYNNATCELMFVEGKVFSDRRVCVAHGFVPEVIAQVGQYSLSVAEQEQNIVLQYSRYISIVNNVFGTAFNAPQRVIKPAKLLVYDCNFNTQNRAYSRDIIGAKLGIGNVLWLEKGERPTSAEIWERLNG